MKKLIFGVFAVLSVLSAGSDPVDEFACPAYGDQGSSPSKLWVCPGLPNYSGVTTKVLEDINFAVGEYQCGYLNESHKEIASCRYFSKTYADSLKKADDNIYGSLYDSDTLSRHIGKSDKFTLDINRDINTLSIPMSSKDTTIVSKLDILSSSALSKMDALINGKGKKRITQVSASLAALNSMIDKHLVQPYSSPSAASVKKDGNFALFIGGLVTLDSDMIKGYNGANGKLDVTTDWKTKATAASASDASLVSGISSGVSKFVGWFTHLFTGGSKEFLATKEIKGEMQLEVSSWIDVFEMKLWGFYYNYSKKMDIGYNIMATTLVGIMFIWFAMGFSFKGGVSHVLNREGGFQTTEGHVMKGAAIMLGVSIFFISLPTPSPGGGAPEFRKNKTIMKWLIRYSVKQGAEFGTMVADLGLASYLEFIVKKQYVYGAEDIVNSYKSAVEPMKIFFPASNVVKECTSYYRTTEQAMYSSVDSSAFTTLTKTAVASRPFFSGNNLNALTWNLCAKAMRIKAGVPYEVAYGINEAINNVDRVSKLMTKSVSLLVQNQILMEDKMGWVSAFSVPLSYFMMRDADMFLDPGMDIDKIAEKSQEFANALGYKDQSALESKDTNDGIWATASYYFSRTSSRAQEGLAKAVGFMTSIMAYKVLPGFSDMQSGIYNILSEALKITAIKKTTKKSEPIKSAKRTFMKAVGKVTGGIGSVAGKIIGSIMSSSMGGYIGTVAQLSAMMLISFVVAIGIWNMAFSTIFMSVISVMLLLKITLYFKDVLIHFSVSPFVAAWAFSSTKQGNGESVMISFMRDTLVLMFYPTIIVIAGYLFIFVEGLFDTLFIFLGENVIQNMQSSVSLMSTANSGVSSFGAYYNLYVLLELFKIVVKLASLVLAYLMFFRFPDTVLAKLGLGQTNVNVAKSAEFAFGKQERSVNPIL